MPELSAILVEARKQRHEDRVFMAALQGVDLNAGATEDEFARVQKQAAQRVAELTGGEEEIVDPSLREFMENGFDYEDLTNV